MDKKRQHTIPQCYLKAWCDPTTPTGYEPYVWVHSKDGRTSKKIAPKNTFVENDFYTLKLSNGKRELVIEDSLSAIEGKCAALLRNVIGNSQPLKVEERGNLCYFVAMMSARTKAHRDHQNAQFSKLHDMTVALERQHQAARTTSLESEVYANFGMQLMMGHSLQTIAPALFEMELTIFIASGKSRFVTSDGPCVWFNPDSYKMPPLFRSPGLAQDKIEITLPLSPTHFAFFSWHSLRPMMKTLTDADWEQLGGYIPIPDSFVDELNRRTVGHCAENFVTHNGEILEQWLNPGERPKDSWEDTQGQAVA